jgi:hypothetical protein
MVLVAADAPQRHGDPSSTQILFQSMDNEIIVVAESVSLHALQRLHM